MASVTATMTWLSTFGRMWRKMMRPSPAPTATAARTYSMRASAIVFERTSRLKLRPAEHRQDADDEGDEDVGRRGHRDQRGQRQIERQLREGEDDLDEALQPGVEAAADIARGDAEAGADDGGDA